MPKVSSSALFRRYGIHAIRVALLIAILTLIHLQYAQLHARQEAVSLSAIDLSLIQAQLPNAHAIGESPNASGGLPILDTKGVHLGYILQTSPQSDRIVGFSGPSNMLLIFDGSNKLTDLHILSSADTPAHVRQVTEEVSFFAAFLGHTEQQLATLPIVDGVSGATLTSLSIQESIQNRLGVVKISLRFPEPITVENALPLFPDATWIQTSDDFPSVWKVYDTTDAFLGTLVRTSPAADSTIGYQGPTDCLIAFNPLQRITGIHLGKTYDNEEYVDYIRSDEYFLTLFNTLSEPMLSELDLKAAEVEGVSGATMTSMAIARGLIVTAQSAALHQSTRPTQKNLWGNWSRHDVGTTIMILLALLIGFTRLRGHKYIRVLFPVVLIIYLGLVNGDMLSQAMIAGWTRHGIPWNITPGLILLSAAAILLPITTRTNIYCHHICPHGALQQLLRKISPKRIRLSTRTTRILKKIPGILLILCVLITMTSTTFSLVDMEPFDAWVFQIAGWATISIAIIGLVAAFFIPMAYCKFGCPTGYLLNFLRLNAHSDRWGRSDWTAVLLFLVSLCLWKLS